MDCDWVRRELLDVDWDEDHRRRMAAVLSHFEDCESCKSAMADFDGLRSRLRQSEDTAEPESGWKAFEARLTRTTITAERQWKPAKVALAASLLLAIAGWGMYLRANINSRVIPVNVANRWTELGLTPQEVIERAGIFGQVSEVFEGRASWVLVGNHSSDLGLGRDPGELAEKLLLLRLSVSQGKTMLSSIDLAIVAGETAELSIPTERGPRLRYQIVTSKGNPSRLELWVQVDRPGAAQGTLAALATSLSPEPGQVVSAGQMATPAGRYEVNVGLYATKLPT